jgi:hypothetical protein
MRDGKEVALREMKTGTGLAYKDPSFAGTGTGLSP